MSVQELTAGHSLRATHEILSTLSGAKKALESILENQTDIFALITESGQILKGNIALSHLMKMPADVLFRANMRTLFSNESWLLFNGKMNTLQKQRDRNGISFELILDGDKEQTHEPQDFLWSITRFDAISNRRGQLFTIVGRDMTEVKHFQKRISTIFNSVPLAIFQINRQKQLLGPYSAFTEIIFGRDNLNRLPVNEVLVQAFPNMSSTQRFGIEQLLDSIGGEEFWFDFYKSHFPKELNLSAGQDDSWIGLSYSPVVRDGRVDEILVVAEDITERVKNRKIKDSRDNIEGTYAVIFSDARETDPKTIDLIVAEIEMQFKKLSAVTEENFQSATALLNPLHAIKGIARGAGLAFFTSLVHRLEDELITAEAAHTPLADLLQTFERRRREIEDTWHTVKSVLRIVHPHAWGESPVKMEALLLQLKGVYEALEKGQLKNGQEILARLIDQSTKTPKSRYTRELENNIRATALKTAESLKKDITLEFDIDDVVFHPGMLSSVNEILTHLITNAIDHGVEERAVRMTSKKPPIARIKVTIKKQDENLFITVEDDGRGIDPAALAKSAVDKKIVSEAAAEAMSRDDKLRLIFSAGVSTKTNTSEISGRGIGLEAAELTAKAISVDGQGIRVQSIVGRGSSFQFSCKPY